MTASWLHRGLCDLSYAGGYTAVKDVLRSIRPSAVPGFEARFETPPGRQPQVDFAHFRAVFTGEPGVERVVWLFSLVLGHRRMLWGRFVPQQDMQTVLRCHAAAFEALRGAPTEILYDRVKTAVDREVAHERIEPGHIVYNRTLVEFARHYGYLPKACKACRANTKSRRIRLSQGIPLQGEFVIQDGERWRFAMAVPLRGDFDAVRLRVAARRTEDAAQVRRLLSLAAVYDGATRTEAAMIGGVTLQIVRDWVLKFNIAGPDGLIDRKAPGQPSRLTDAHRAGERSHACCPWRGAVAPGRPVRMALGGTQGQHGQADAEPGTARYGLAQDLRPAAPPCPG